jgi:hypothetical protein
VAHRLRGAQDCFTPCRNNKGIYISVPLREIKKTDKLNMLKVLCEKGLTQMMFTVTL